MDLLTQGLLGGVLASAAAPKAESRYAAIAGFGAALLADADVFISSGDDPLLNLEFHRHFTHSLIFVPLGALLAALLLWTVLRNRLDFRRIYFYALLGYATSGLLDACTSYGTHLLWPFSETRIAWSIIAIVDPLFSLLLLVALIAALFYRKALPARIGLGMAGAYLLVGLGQHYNALQAANELAAQRGHEVERILVKPTLANLVLWRSVYRSGDRYYVDAIRVGTDSQRIYPGTSVPAFERERDMRQLAADSVLAQDIQRFAVLADGFLVRDRARDNVLSDIRYAMLPNIAAPMWGIELNLADPSQHADFKVYRDAPQDHREQFLIMLRGRKLPR